MEDNKYSHFGESSVIPCFLIWKCNTPNGKKNWELPKEEVISTLTNGFLIRKWCQFSRSCCICNLYRLWILNLKAQLSIINTFLSSWFFSSFSFWFYIRHDLILLQQTVSFYHPFLDCCGVIISRTHHPILPITLK